VPRLNGATKTGPYYSTKWAGRSPGRGHRRG